MLEELNGDFLQWLRGFYHIAQSGSIRKAAVLMNRNPSTLSYQLRCLEEELGTVLFDRYKKSLQITPEGERLLGWTVSTFETLQGMRADLGAVSGDLQGTITVSSNLPFAVQAVRSVAEFRDTHPLVNIRIRRALDQGVVEDVAGSRVDFGLAALADAPEGCVFEELFRSRPLLIVHKDHDYKLSARPGPDEVNLLPVVSFLSEQLTPINSPLLSAEGGENAGLAGRPVLSVNNYHLMLRYVMLGMGAAIMDEMCYKSSQYGSEWKALRTCPLDFLPTLKYGLLVRKGKRLSPQAKGLMERIRDNTKNMELSEALS